MCDIFPSPYPACSQRRHARPTTVLVFFLVCFYFILLVLKKKNFGWVWCFSIGASSLVVASWRLPCLRRRLGRRYTYTQPPKGKDLLSKKNGSYDVSWPLYTLELLLNWAALFGESGGSALYIYFSCQKPGQNIYKYNFVHAFPPYPSLSYSYEWVRAGPTILFIYLIIFFRGGGGNGGFVGEGSNT